jgi:hypothetical protein
MNRSSNALTLEMAVSAVPFLLLANGSADPATLFAGWTAETLIPVTTSALGGIFVVGLCYDKVPQTTWRLCHFEC